MVDGERRCSSYEKVLKCTEKALVVDHDIYFDDVKHEWFNKMKDM
jgi:hypothetical protein